MAIFVPSLRGGGAEKTMVTLANAFVDKGIKVDLLLAKAEGSYLKDISASVRLVDFNTMRVSMSLAGLVRYLRRERPEVLLSALRHANIVAVTACWISRVSSRVIVSERNNVSISLKNAKLLRSRTMIQLLRRAYLAADAIVAVSQGVAEDLAVTAEIPRKRISVIYNPITNRSLLKESYEDVDHSWFSAGAVPVVLAVGRLVEQKQFGTLIQAFAQVRRHRKLKLMILGEGRLRNELVLLAKKLGVEADVALPGFVNNPYAYMRRAALLVLSSDWEGLPGVLIQAMACGTPVVSTDCPSGPAEILEDGKWGRLVSVGDIDGLSEAIVKTLDDCNPPDVSRRADDFSVARSVTHYLEILFPEAHRVLEER